MNRPGIVRIWYNYCFLQDMYSFHTLPKIPKQRVSLGFHSSLPWLPKCKEIPKAGLASNKGLRFVFGLDDDYDATADDDDDDDDDEMIWYDMIWYDPYDSCFRQQLDSNCISPLRTVLPCFATGGTLVRANEQASSRRSPPILTTSRCLHLAPWTPGPKTGGRHWDATGWRWNRKWQGLEGADTRL